MACLLRRRKPLISRSEWCQVNRKSPLRRFLGWPLSLKENLHFRPPELRQAYDRLIMEGCQSATRKSALAVQNQFWHDEQAPAGRCRARNSIVCRGWRSLGNGGIYIKTDTYEKVWGKRYSLISHGIQSSFPNLLANQA